MPCGHKAKVRAILKIAAAQLRPNVGDWTGNLQLHLNFTFAAARHGVGLLVFPELSLTGYEPARATELAREANDTCFHELQRMSVEHRMTIAVGFPLRTEDLPQIASKLLYPNRQSAVYTKMFLHSDEEEYFSPGMDSPTLILDVPAVALAICFELTIPAHAQRALMAGAEIYIASVAKTARGITAANERLSQIAAELAVPVLMSNCLGAMDGSECCGMSGIWDTTGTQLSHLGDAEEGLLILDLETGEIEAEMLTR